MPDRTRLSIKQALMILKEYHTPLMRNPPLTGNRKNYDLCMNP